MADCVAVLDAAGSPGAVAFGSSTGALVALGAAAHPERTTALVARGGHAPDRILSTVLFTDIVASTELAASLGDHRWRNLLDAHDRESRHQIERFGGRVVKTTGDGVMATFDQPRNAVHAAAALRTALLVHGVELRAGIHTGEIEVRGDDIGGIAVNIAARVDGLAEAGQILVSRTLVDVVTGSDLEFDDHGVHVLKGVPGDWQLFALRQP